MVEILDRLQCRLVLARSLQRMGAGQCLFPVGTERLDDRGDDQPLDIGARRVVGAELGALPPVERALQQRAEDRGLDIAPVAPRRDVELADIVLLQRDRLALPEQRAVEALDHRVQMRGVAALVHHPPQALQRRGEMLGRLDHVTQQSLEPLLGQKADILGEHGEEAAHEEFRDLLGVVLAFQALGDTGEALGNVAGDFGAAFGRIERVRVAPDRTQPVADGLVAQACQRDGIALAVRELGVVLPLAGKVGIDLDHVAHIDDQDEGRPAVLLRQRAGVILRLPLGGAHHPVPATRAAGGCAGLDLRGVFGDQTPAGQDRPSSP